jgi:hypothetical protein
MKLICTEMTPFHVSCLLLIYARDDGDLVVHSSQSVASLVDRLSTLTHIGVFGNQAPSNPSSISCKFNHLQVVGD